MNIRTLFQIEDGKMFACAADIARLIGLSKLSCAQTMFDSTDTMGRKRMMAYIDVIALKQLLEKYKEKIPYVTLYIIQKHFELE